MNTIRKYIGPRTLKTVIGTIIAVYISQKLNLAYAANSGIIVILSVQHTKKRSLDLAVMRIGSTVLALTIGTVVFSTLGFTALAFGIYLLVFIPIAVKLKFNDGIVPCSVLVTHLLAIQSVTFAALSNEMMQMLIGAGIGFVLNIYMPSLENKLDQDAYEIDQMMKTILKNMAERLRKHDLPTDESLYDNLELKLKEGYERAWKEAENRLNKKVTFYVKFMEARIVQFEILHHMKRYFNRLYATCEQTTMVAELTEYIADQFQGIGMGEEIFEVIESYRKSFKKMDLPTTREEFENRATLYEYINDLEHFLESKDTIVETLV
jgi:uncharacterized membrane protein YgaE (UPF0421/DUF939 family)